MSSPGSLRVTVDARPLDIDFLRDQGIGRFAAGLLSELPAVARERGGELVLLRAAGQAQAPAFAEPSGARSIRLPRPAVPERYADLAEQLLLPLNLCHARAGVHHSLSIYRAPVAPGVPSVVTFHDAVPLMWPEEYLRTGVVHRLLYAAVRRADRVIAVSQAARREAVELVGVDESRIEVVHEAADARFVPTEPGEVPPRSGLTTGPYVLWVGGLSNEDPRKRVGELIDAFAEWTRERERLETLVLAGRVGPTGEPLRERARRSTARVVFTDFVPDDDLPALYSGARCTVTASRHEGFGLPALESLACGTPIAGFEVGALPEVAGPGALLAGDGDFTALMDAVETLCDEPQRRTELAEAGLAHASRFSWRNTAERTWDVYERAAGRT